MNEHDVRDVFDSGVDPGHSPPNESAADKTKQAAATVKAEAKQGAEETARGVARQAQAKAEAGKHRIADRMDTVAGAIDHFSDELHQKDEPWLSDGASSVAVKVRQVSQRLHDKPLTDLSHDLRDWSRNPTLFLGGAFAIGLAAGRFLTSSSKHLKDIDLDEGEYVEIEVEDAKQVYDGSQLAPPVPAKPYTGPASGTAGGGNL